LSAKMRLFNFSKINALLFTLRFDILIKKCLNITSNYKFSIY